MHKIILSAATMTLGILMSTAVYAEEEIIISTDTDLSEVIGAESGTEGKVYTLDNDIEISTAGLDRMRCFEGTFDGGGHTITIIGEDTPSEPLFGRLTNGSSIKDLKIDLKGDVYGAALAHDSDADVDGVEIFFEKDILYAKAGDIAYACGLFGMRGSGESIQYIRNTKITGGDIGSASAPDAKNVTAAGVFANVKNTSAGTVLDNVDIDVDDICSFGGDTTVTGTEYDAAGVVSGCESCSYLRNVNVNVSGDIKAGSDQHTAATAKAYGLGCIIRGMYSSNVNVEGKIWSKVRSSAPVSEKYDIIHTSDGSFGMAWCLGTKENEAIFGVSDTGASYVRAGGGIISEVTNSDNMNVYSAGAAAVYGDGKIDSIDVDTTDITAKISGNNNKNKYTYATGLLILPESAETECYVENCQANADGKISSVCGGGDPYAEGFIYDASGIEDIRNCHVSVTTIEALDDTNTEGYADGFLRYNNKGDIADCSVKADNMIASGRSDHCSGFIYRLSTGHGRVENCSVEIAKAFTCRQKALFAAYNDTGYDLYNNIIKIPGIEIDWYSWDMKKRKYNKKDISKMYLQFTANEYSGHEASGGWESGNRLVLTDTGDEYEVNCARIIARQNALWGIADKPPVKIRFFSDSGFCSDNFVPEAGPGSTGVVAVSAIVDDFDVIKDRITKLGFDHGEDDLAVDDDKLDEAKGYGGAFYTLFYNIPYEDLNNTFSLDPYIVFDGKKYIGPTITVDGVTGIDKWLGKSDEVLQRHSDPIEAY